MNTTARINGLLLFLVLLDGVLVPWAFFYPELWFQVWHGAPYVDPQAFLARCGANWLGFFLLQVLALWRWKQERWWLAVVAGVRLSDVFTDLTSTLLAQDVSLWAKVLFPLMGFGNLLFGLLLLWAYRAAPSPGTTQ